MMNLESFITEVPNFPKPGVNFKDITPLLSDGKALNYSCDMIADMFRSQKIDLVAGIESRGFIFGTGVALKLGCGFVPVRKHGKLPRSTFKESYNLEYGSEVLEIHRDAFKQNARVLIVDDVIATGGTIKATKNLIQAAGGFVVAAAFVIELSFLQGRKFLENLKVESLLKY